MQFQFVLDCGFVDTTHNYEHDNGLAFPKKVSLFETPPPSFHYGHLLDLFMHSTTNVRCELKVFFYVLIGIYLVITC